MALVIVIDIAINIVIVIVIVIVIDPNTGTYYSGGLCGGRSSCYCGGTGGSVSCRWSCC